MIPRREIYARIEISAKDIQRQVAIDRALSERMISLSEKHRHKAQRRIRGQRWMRFYNAELKAIADGFRNWSLDA